MLCQLSYRGSLGSPGRIARWPGAREIGRSARISRARPRRGPGRGPPRRPPPYVGIVGVDALLELVDPGQRAVAAGARRAITKTPRRPRTGTCRCSTTLAVTRSRTSWRKRPGSSTASVWTGRCSPQEPTSTRSGRCRGPSRPSRPAPTAPGARRRRSRRGCRPRPCRPRPRPRPAPSPPAAPGVRRRDGVRPPHAAAHRRSCMLAAVLLERDQLTEHAVVLRRVLDRVGALQLGLEVGDAAQGGQLLEPEDVGVDVGGRRAPWTTAAARRRGR